MSEHEKRDWALLEYAVFCLLVSLKSEHAHALETDCLVATVFDTAESPEKTGYVFMMPEQAEHTEGKNFIQGCFSRLRSRPIPGTLLMIFKRKGRNSSFAVAELSYGGTETVN